MQCMSTSGFKCLWSSWWFLSFCLCVQTELTDGITMMVGNNDRIQGIISQLDEACRAIEVSVKQLQRPAAHSGLQPVHAPTHL